MMTLFKKVLWHFLPKSIYYPLLHYFIRTRAKLTSSKNLLAAKIRHKLSLPVNKKKRSKIRFGVHIAEHCNLNCAYCLHFSPIAEKELMSVEDFKRDIERMGELFNHECELIELYGGEPLLHPEIITLMEIARKNFTSGKIHILSNGILLAQQKPEFWKACHDNNIEISVTHYDIDINLPKIRELARQYDAAFNCVDYSRLMFQTMHIDLSGKGDGLKNFAVCSDANTCILLGQGKLYICPFAYSIRHFNKHFGMNIPVSEEDYIDIFKENNSDKILERLTRQIPLCKFCNFYNLGEASWRLTERNINEWV